MVANLNDVSWGTRQNNHLDGKPKKDMGIFGGIVNSFCSMCMGEATCTECCCNDESHDSDQKEEASEVSLNNLMNKNNHYVEGAPDFGRGLN